MACSYEHGNKSPDSVIGGDVIDHLSNNQFLENSTPCSLLEI
jgi:hypothetical protein